MPMPTSARCAPIALLLFTLAAGCQPVTPEELKSAANEALAKGELRTAEIHVKNLLQQQPQDVEARILLANISLASGDAAMAEQSLRTAEKNGADAATIQLPLLQSLIAQNKLNDVITQFESGPQLSGKDQVLAIKMAAAAYQGLGGVDKAEGLYRRALELEPDSLDIKTDIAALYFRMQRMPEAVALLNEVFKADPQFSAAVLLRGNMELTRRQYQAAAASFEQVLAAERSGDRRTANYTLARAQLIEAQLALKKVDEAAAGAEAFLADNPTSPVAQYLKARVEVEQGQLEDAEGRLAKLVTDYPRYAPPYRLLGTIKAKQEQLGQAEMYLRGAVQAAPGDAEARLALAELYIREGNVDAARTVIDDATQEGEAPNSVFLARAARTSQQAGVADLATEYFDKAEEGAQPKNLQELVDLSRVYVASGEFERAIRTLESATFDDAQSPDEQFKSYLLALIRLRQGDTAGAATAAERLAQEMPSSAWAQSFRATVAMLGRDFETARAAFEKSLALEPDNVEGLLGLARLAFLEKDQDGAADNLKRVLAKDPRNPLATFSLAQIETSRGNFAEASALLARAPESSVRSRLEGDVFAAQQRFDEAATAYSHSYELEANPDTALKAFAAATRARRPQPQKEMLAWSAANPKDARMNFALGSAAMSTGDQSEALRRFEAVLEADPSNAAALNNAAWLYSEQGNPRAMELAEKALEIQPANPEIMDTVGWLHVQNGDAKSGLAHLQRAAAARPEAGEIQYHLAVALAETGDERAARDLLAKLLEGDADFPSKNDARERLATLK
jgi:putative PEP-CTERM system TPR-repeat lipoprotein